MPKKLSETRKAVADVIEIFHEYPMICDSRWLMHRVLTDYNTNFSFSAIHLEGAIYARWWEDGIEADRNVLIVPSGTPDALRSRLARLCKQYQSRELRKQALKNMKLEQSDGSYRSERRILTCYTHELQVVEEPTVDDVRKYGYETLVG